MPQSTTRWSDRSVLTTEGIKNIVPLLSFSSIWYGHVIDISHLDEPTCSNHGHFVFAESSKDFFLLVECWDLRRHHRQRHLETKHCMSSQKPALILWEHRLDWTSQDYLFPQLSKRLSPSQVLDPCIYSCPCLSNNLWQSTRTESAN